MLAIMCVCFLSKLHSAVWELILSSTVVYLHLAMFLLFLLFCRSWSRSLSQWFPVLLTFTLAARSNRGELELHHKTHSFSSRVCVCVRAQDTASLGSQKGGISRQGWLYKGNMNSAISVTMRVRHLHSLHSVWNWSYTVLLPLEQNWAFDSEVTKTDFK